jgi:16S rRNA (cytidine1402-2'-O)-methyltransferase
MPGILYIVATPIGNLEDMTLRAIRVMREADLVLCEDTRVSKKLMMHYDINTPITSYYQHSSEAKKLEVLGRLGRGENITLITDAGTPGISDPGNELIEYLLEHNFALKIVPIPGPSAITTSISVSGFPMSKFLFLGFFPKKKRTKLIELIKLTKLPIVFYESPYRILKTLEYLSEHLGGDINIFIARELTKLHETLYRGKISEVIAQLEKEKIRGEIVVIAEGKRKLDVRG